MAGSEMVMLEDPQMFLKLLDMEEWAKFPTEPSKRLITKNWNCLVAVITTKMVQLIKESTNFGFSFLHLANWATSFWIYMKQR